MNFVSFLRTYSILPDVNITWIIANRIVRNTFWSILCINTLRSRQNGRHFPDDIFKYISLNEIVWISIKISLKFVPKGPINYIPKLVQTMVGAGQATSHCLNQWWLVYWRIHASWLTHICVTRPKLVNGTWYENNIPNVFYNAAIPIYPCFNDIISYSCRMPYNTHTHPNTCTQLHSSEVICYQ